MSETSSYFHSLYTVNNPEILEWTIPGSARKWTHPGLAYNYPPHLSQEWARPGSAREWTRSGSAQKWTSRIRRLLELLRSLVDG